METEQPGTESLADRAARWVPPWERPTLEPDQQDEGTRPAPTPRDEAGAEAVADPRALAQATAPNDLELDDVELDDSEPGGGAELDAADPDEAGAVGLDGVGLDGVGVDADGFDGDGFVPAAAAVAVVVPDPRTEADALPAAADEAEPSTALALLDDAELRGALEAIMLVVDEPISEIMLAQVLEQPTERVSAALAALSAQYTVAGHGFDLRQAAGGWRLYTRPRYAPYVERFVLDGQQSRLTQAALETLAVVAYKQPVTRSRISAIRGVNCDGVIRTLVSRGLVQECGTEPESGAFLYRTTSLFLEKLGLNSVADLPPLAPFLPDDFEEIADGQT